MMVTSSGGNMPWQKAFLQSPSLRVRRRSTVGNLPKAYVRNVPLPRVPKTQRARSHPVTTILDYYMETYIVPMQDIPRSLAGDATYAPPPAWHAIAINT